jgi:hypothetical protein
MGCFWRFFDLEVLESHVERDVGKIQNLDVAGRWGMQPPRQPRSIADGASKEGLSLTLKAFKSSKRLKVYHSDSGKSPGDGIMDESGGDDSDAGNGIWENNHLVDDFLVRRDPNELKEEILKVLKEQKVLYESWTQDLPEVEISKELLYSWQYGEEARLELRFSTELHWSGVFESV